jgi:2,4'-dihydroxyacetophenone dioxygenase
MDLKTLLPSHELMTRWDAPWIEQSPMTFVKMLWVGREINSWALLGLWKAGFVSGRHKHLAPAHVFVVSGKMVSGDVIMAAGDYIYEPAGVVHEATTAIEDTVQLFISEGPIARLDAHGGITSVTNWDDIEKMRHLHKDEP